MICTIQDAIIKLLKADMTRFVGHVSDSTVIRRDSFNCGILDNYPDMRTLVTNSVLIKLDELRYEYNAEESDIHTLVFDNLAFRDLIQELRSLLNGKRLSIETFEDYLINKDFTLYDIELVENYLKKIAGFTMDSRSITYQE